MLNSEPTPPHGTESRYNAGCRLTCCRDAHAAGARHRRRMKAYGRHVPRSVPNVGTRRRAEALMCLGWSLRAQSRMLGWHPDRLSVMLKSSDGISPRNQARMCALYDQLWNVCPRPSTRGERQSVGRTIALARRRGYVPPLALDDDTIEDFFYNGKTAATRRIPREIDEIAVERAMRGDPVRLTNAEKSLAVVTMTGWGYSAREIAQRLGTTDRSVVRRRASAAA